MHQRGIRKLALSAIDRFEQKYGRRDPLLRTRELAKHSCGKYSFAIVSPNDPGEQRSELQTASNAIFVGIYDGHGGDAVSSFLENGLFIRLMTEARQQTDLNAETLARTMGAMEQQYLEHARNTKHDDPDIVKSGSSCLIGAIFRRRLQIANLGDSRAVLGYKQNGRIHATSLNDGHTVNNPSAALSIDNAHILDPHAIITIEGRHLIKGRVKVSKSIGDANLKYADCAGPDELSEILLGHPYLTSDPEVVSREWEAQDKFVIFASDAVWRIFSPDHLVELVYNSPKKGIARRIITQVLKGVAAAARARNIPLTYDQLLAIPASSRRHYHDDITVVVVFIDFERLGRRQQAGFPARTVKRAAEFPNGEPPPFTEIEHLMGDHLPPNNN